jgi:hypothetical protein
MISLTPSIPTLSSSSLRSNHKFKKELLTPQSVNAFYAKEKPLHFAGDALAIYNKLKGISFQVDSLSKHAPLKSKNEAFKSIGDLPLWGKDGDRFNTAEMLSFLCTVRKEEHYKGYGTAETLAKCFPGLNAGVLETVLDSLHANTYSVGKKQYTLNYVGKNPYTQVYWLRPEGLEMLQNVYPDLKLPAPKDRFVFSGVSFGPA